MTERGRETPEGAGERTRPSRPPTDHPLLARALLGNAAFSGLSGTALLVGPAWIGSWLGLSGTGILRVLGVGLAGFAVALASLARSDEPAHLLVGLASAADFAWVAGSVALLLGFPGLLTGVGKVAVAGVAVLVAAFGTAQLVGLRRSPGF